MRVGLFRAIPGVMLMACTGSSVSTLPPKVVQVEQGADVTGTKTNDEAAAYARGCQESLQEARKLFASLEAHEGEKTVGTVLEPMNELWRVIDKQLHGAELVRNVHPDDDVRGAADRCEQDFAKLVTDIGLSRSVYKSIQGLVGIQDDPQTERLVAKLRRDFRRAGVDKDEATRDRIRLLKEQLIAIGQAFGKNIREDVRAIELDSVEDLAGLPQDYVASHPPDEQGKIRITTDYPDYLPFLLYAQNDGRRLELYRQFKQRGYPKNGEILAQLLAKRHELANLLGYETWAAYITEDKMVKNAATAHDFIDKIAELSKPRAKIDYDELLAVLRRTQPDAKEVGDWQNAHLQEVVKKEKFDFDSQEVRQYFTYEKVRQGVFDTISRMFGISFKPANGDVWHASVEVYDVYDDGDKLGRFYLDMHPREDKYKHAAVFGLQAGLKGHQLPEAALVCNFPQSGPMEHGQVETFFHEFGHLLHHLLSGQQRWIAQSAFETEWDFVEAPSQMLEEWAWSAASLRAFATNEAGEPIPEELVERMRRARGFGKGLWTSHQMFYAAVSLNYHDRDPRSFETGSLAKNLQNSYSPFRHVDDTYFHLSFGHLDGYSAIYYTYMWSLVIAKDLFREFANEGMLNQSVAERYRNTILAPGGSKHAADMIKDFLGRPHSFEAFSAWLNDN